MQLEAYILRHVVVFFVAGVSFPVGRLRFRPKMSGFEELRYLSCLILPGAWCDIHVALEGLNLRD
jgi:hypothetical protein